MPTCQACKQPMVRITVLDRGHGQVFEGFSYTLDEAPDVSWTGKVKNAAGKIHAHLCTSCHQVAWYAEPDA